MEKSNPLGGMQTGEVALNAAIAAEKAHRSPFLSAGVHALYGMIQGDVSLKKKFLQAFQERILEELEQYAQSGSLAEISRHQILVNVYSDIPTVKKHMKEFAQKMSQGGYPWVNLVVRRIEMGITSGLQIGNENLLIQSLHDLQRYIAVTGGIGVFNTLRSQVKETLQEYFRKKLIQDPSSNPLRVLERKEQMDRLIEICTLQGILDSGLEEVRQEVESNPSAQPLCALAEAHTTLKALQKKLGQLEEAKKGIGPACAALKQFQQQPIEPALRQAIERGHKNVPGVQEWHQTFDSLNQVHALALQNNVEAQMKGVKKQLEAQEALFQKAQEAFVAHTNCIK